jgi:hypothetical protein
MFFFLLSGFHVAHPPPPYQKKGVSSTFFCQAFFFVTIIVGEFRKTRHPRNVELNKVLKACFSGAGNSRFSEVWNL